MRAYAQATLRAVILNGYSIEFLVARNTDGDEVSVKFFITCPVEFTFLRLLGNDDVIYEVIARKFRASVEPF